jgi:hypothetical protein
MDQEISLSRVKLYLHNISLWNSAKNYSNFFFKLSTAVNPEEYFNTYQTYFQLFPTVKSALHAVQWVQGATNHNAPLCPRCHVTVELSHIEIAL